VYVGDGATSTGAFHEGINFAAVQRCPLVVIVENNGYAYSTPTSKQTACTSFKDKAIGYGIPGLRADGNDVVATYEVTKEAVDRARRGEGVTLIELMTYRRKGHAEHDDQRYVSKEELETWEARDPVARYERWLLSQGIVDQQQLEQIDARVRRKLDAAVDEAEKAPMPEPRTALDDVWSTPRWPHASPNYHDFTKEVGE
jgi:pyruvate dehydrogenase E1 component alpha subunit/2-oxoisovalerate dehydrogenase E1 component alpha subunit